MLQLSHFDSKYDSVSSIIKISDEQFGVGFINPEHILETPHNTFISKLNGEVVGFAITDMLGEHVGELQTIATDGEYQGEGYGSRLIDYVELIFRVRGASMVISPAWSSPKGVNIGRLLTSKGYKAGEIEEDPWTISCDRKVFSCPERTNKCQCWITWYTKHLT